MSSSDVVAKKYNMFERRQAIPVLYCRGTHYEVGYDVVSLQLVFFSCKMKVNLKTKVHNRTF